MSALWAEQMKIGAFHTSKLISLDAIGTSRIIHKVTRSDCNLEASRVNDLDSLNTPARSLMLTFETEEMNCQICQMAVDTGQTVVRFPYRELATAVFWGARN